MLRGDVTGVTYAPARPGPLAIVASLQFDVVFPARIGLGCVSAVGAAFWFLPSKESDTHCEPETTSAL